MVGSAQGVAQSVDRSAAGVAKGDAAVGAGQEEVLEQRDAGLGALVPDFHVALEDDLNGLVPKELGDGVGFGREAGLDGVDEGIDGTGGEDGQGEGLQQLRDQHGLVAEHAGGAQTLLGVQGDESQNGEVGDLAAGAAGGGHQDELLPLFQGDLAVVQVQDGGNGLEAKHLGDVHHGAAAHGDDPGDVLGHVVVDGGDHLVGGLAGAILLLEDGGAGEVQRTEVGIIDILVGEDQILGPQLQGLGKLCAGVANLNGGLYFKLGHGIAPQLSWGDGWD